MVGQAYRPEVEGSRRLRLSSFSATHARGGTRGVPRRTERQFMIIETTGDHFRGVEIATNR